MAIPEIHSTYDTANLRHSLSTYPARIKEHRVQLAQARQALKEAELARAERESEILLDISVETDERGKARYSNAEMRAAAIMLKKRNDLDYQSAADQAITAEAEATEAQDALQQTLDEFQAARIAARLIAAEMAMLSEIADVGDLSETSPEHAVRAEVSRYHDPGFRSTKYREAF